VGATCSQRPTPGIDRSARFLIALYTSLASLFIAHKPLPYGQHTTINKSRSVAERSGYTSLVN